MKVVLADKSDLSRIGIRTILSKVENVEIVGEAESEEQLLELLSLFEVDVVVVDFTSEGFEVRTITRLKKKHPDVDVLAITPEQSAQVLVDALKSGVTSYVKKDCSVKEIIDAIKETSKGVRFFCGKIIETIQQANLKVEDIDSELFSCDPVVISEREREIITLISEGLTNAQIAEKLFLSNHTVVSHRKNIMAKLGVKNTAGIVMYAVKTGLIRPNKFLFSAE